MYIYIKMRIKAPLFSLEARGSIGNVITYSRRWGKNYAREFVKPLKPASAQQASQRSLFKSIITEWNALTINERIGWQAVAYLVPPLSGYNIFLRMPAVSRNVHMFGNVLFGTHLFGGAKAKP